MHKKLSTYAHFRTAIPLACAYFLPIPLPTENPALWRAYDDHRPNFFGLDRNKFCILLPFFRLVIHNQYTSFGGSVVR